jgi:hypothetical protein
MTEIKKRVNRVKPAVDLHICPKNVILNCIESITYSCDELKEYLMEIDSRA